jgi:hypothetical protein
MIWSITAREFSTISLAPAGSRRCADGSQDLLAGTLGAGGDLATVLGRTLGQLLPALGIAEQVGHAGLAGQLLVLLRQTADLVIGGHERVEAGRQHLAGGQHAFQRRGDDAQLLGGMLDGLQDLAVGAWLAGSSVPPDARGCRRNGP